MLKVRCAFPRSTYSENSPIPLDQISAPHTGWGNEGKIRLLPSVSTDKQGQTGYGIDAQRAAVASYLNGGDWQLIGEFVEVESGKRKDRPELAKALVACRKHKAKLVIAKLDRLARNSCADRQSDGWESRFRLLRHAAGKPATIHVLAAVAEHEREMISDRTKAAAKARGVKLGGPGLPAINESRRVDSVARARAIAPILSELASMSARAAAAELNARKIEPPSGAPWSAKTVIRARARMGFSAQ